jgi:ATP adenylyltransferase
MSMEQLWAPWRLAYVVKDAPPKSDDDCFICRGLAQSEDRRNLIVHRGAQGVVLLNRYPYNNGHLLIAPKAHKARLDELTKDEVLDVQTILSRMIGVLERLLRPSGFNIGVNLGKSAGAGLPGHLHWHVVPRWDGDTNFMPVVGDTKVIVQSLDALYDYLTADLLIA